MADPSKKMTRPSLEATYYMLGWKAGVAGNSIELTPGPEEFSVAHENGHMDGYRAMIRQWVSAKATYPKE